MELFVDVDACLQGNMQIDHVCLGLSIVFESNQR